MKVFLLLLAFAGTTPILNDQELSLGGIVLGQSEASVIRALGRPKGRTENGSDYLPLELSYPGLAVLLDEQGVGGLISSSKRFCTPAGICPGMSYAEAQQIYGLALVTKTTDRVSTGYLYGDGCWLKLAVKLGKVETMEVACAP